MTDERERPKLPIGKQRRVRELADLMADRLAMSYRRSTTDAADLATLLDETTDRSGNLLGWLREYVRLTARADR
jgi:hypothetical protein